jgi:hypothetical protein
LDRAIDHLTEVLDQAAQASIPHKKPGTRKQKHFTEPELTAIRQGKIVFNKWKAEGRPPNSHPVSIELTTARKNLRSAQRQAAAHKRVREHEEIMQASEYDTKFFYRLIAQQRKVSSSSTTILNVHGTSYNGEVVKGWDSYFADLATPKDDTRYIQRYKQNTDATISYLREAADRSTSMLPLTSVEIRYYISKLNTGKASDESGMTTEHLKFAGSLIHEPLAHIISAAADLRHVPSAMKRGILTPIYKQGGKPLDDPGSYRGITVCSVLSKVLEQFIAVHSEHILLPNQSRLQCGFTSGLSPAYAALMLTEAIAEQKYLRKPLYVATLDAQKAFDVVDHASLLWKWHERGLNGIIWQLKDETYQNMTTKVKWGGLLSNEFTIHQGVRQGGIPSTVDYKLYINALLHQLEESGVGLHIGSTYTGAPTCADDILLMCESINSMQYLLTCCEQYACNERYTIHPTKSVISAYNTQIPNSSWAEIGPWMLYGNTVPVTAETTHLGILREAEKTTTISKFISEKLKLGRRTLYSLVGAGLHGLNGLSVKDCCTVYWDLLMRVDSLITCASYDIYAPK